MAEVDDRAAAAAAFARHIASPEGRAVLKQNGYTEGMQIVVAVSEDLIGHVMARVTAYRPPVVVAVWFAEKSDLKIMSLAPGSPAAASHDDQFSANGTIGMLYELMSAEGRRSIAFKLTDWTGFEASFTPPKLVPA